VLQNQATFAEEMGMLAKTLTFVALGLSVPVSGFALGIRVFDHDAFATARGDAFVATADNPSAIYYNPAGIAQLEGHNARAAVNIASVRAGYENSAFRDVNTGDDFITVPGFFYTFSPKECPISFGVGYYMPYGFSLEWPKNGPFRETTIHGELQYHTFNGIVAWQATKTLSIAAGPTFNYASTDLRRGYAAVGDEFKFTGDDYDLGATAGLLWKPFERHAFGVSYRSQTTMNLEGKSRLLPASYGLAVQDASAKLPFPQVIIAGYSFRPTPNWNLEVDLDWTDWNRVNTPVLKQNSGNVALPLRWESSWAVEAGATRYFENGLHASAGYVYLENSVPNNSFTPLVPDQDMHVFSVGLGGKYERVTWDATYQFTWSPGRDVTGSVYDTPTSHVDGHYTFMAHAFSISIGWHF
jgi:long-chain fatty acid transport protein